MTPYSKIAPWALSTLSGVLYFVGFVGFDQWYLAWICLIPLLFALRTAATWKRALALSWWMGFITHLGGYFWVVHLLESFAHLPTPLAVVGYLLLCAGQGAILAAFGVLAWSVHKRSAVPLGVVAAPALVAVEMSFPLLFPSYLANSQAWVPEVTQIADLGGVLLLSAVIALVNGGLYELLAARVDRRRLPWRLPATAGVALVATLAYSAIRLDQMDSRDAAAPSLKTAIIQANVGAASKHEKPGEGIQRFLKMTEEAMELPGIGLVVWPESGLNRAIGPEVGNLTGWVARDVKSPMIVGALRTDHNGERRRVWNSAVAVETGGAITGQYDKTQLLAFGEYVPGDSIFPGIYDLLPYTSRFERGQSVEPLEIAGYKLSTDICYEDILPAFIRKLMPAIDAEGNRPHAMVNLTNDSWYGPHEPPIHLALSVFRSIEHRRWLIRSTATGISAFVDSSGRLVQRSGFETAEVLVADVPMITDGPTVYGRLGDWPGWLALLACVLGLRPLRRKQAPDAKPAAETSAAGQQAA